MHWSWQGIHGLSPYSVIANTYMAYVTNSVTESVSDVYLYRKHFF
jgi:hypothetical protein